MNKKKIILLILLILIGMIVVYFAFFFDVETEEEKINREQLEAEKRALENEAMIYKNKRIEELKQAIPVKCWESHKSSTSNRPGSKDCAPYQSLIKELQKLRGY